MSCRHYPCAAPADWRNPEVRAHVAPARECFPHGLARGSGAGKRVAQREDRWPRPGEAAAERPGGRRGLFHLFERGHEMGAPWFRHVILERPGDETAVVAKQPGNEGDRKSTRLNSSHLVISYA